jgi:hypothetical protein
MRTKLASLFFSVIIISGCNLKEEVNENFVMGTWRLYDITPKNETVADFSTTANLKKSVKKGSVISFFKDKSYSVIDGSGNFKTGKWSLKQNNSITLTGGELNPGNTSFKTERNGKGKTINSLQIEKGELVFKYLKETNPLEKYSDDPFYTSNNQWRSRPSGPEDTKMLSNRMAGYLKHVALILKGAKERKQEIVSFEFSKGPVKIYNGAIGIHPYDIVPVEWKNCFYNDSNAFAAYSLFEKYLATNNYKGAGVGDWVEDDYNILLSIYADFESLNQ